MVDGSSFWWGFFGLVLTCFGSILINCEHTLFECAVACYIKWVDISFKSVSSVRS